MDTINLDEKTNAVLGELDHLNSLIGLAKSCIPTEKHKKLLTSIQNDIFTLQAHIASPDAIPYLPLQHIFSLQEETYDIESRLPQLHHFIIPEGIPAACLLHCCRTQARSIEQTQKGYLTRPTFLAKYMDRLACLLFAIAREVNQEENVPERPPVYTV